MNVLESSRNVAQSVTITEKVNPTGEFQKKMNKQTPFLRACAFSFFAGKEYNEFRNSQRELKFLHAKGMEMAGRTYPPEDSPV